jgi:very-short-patch-repair endonuclease
MPPVERVLRSHGFFLRRRDLLALGYTDGHLRAALAQKRIFRVRHGWYSVPDAPEVGIRAVRVGGRLTSLSALESYGLPVPRQPLFHVAVKATASRLRNPIDRRVRLSPLAGVCTHWVDRAGGGTPWRASVADALLAVLITESRDVALACCGTALQRRLLTPSALDAIFEEAPARVRGWRRLVSALDESHGETFFRLWLADAGQSCEQQVRIRGAGRFDFRLSAHVYVEIDGAQHDPSWTGESGSSWENDLDRATTMAIRGDRVLHFGYRQLYTDWPRVLAAIERAIADDAALAARRRRHPYRPRAQRKRRRSGAKLPP